MARSLAPEALETLREIARHGKSESARVAASVALLDRGLGKPGQTFDVQLDLNKRLNELSREELVAFRERYLAISAPTIDVDAAEQDSDNGE